MLASYTLIILSCTCAVGVDKEMADVLQDMGLRSVSMDLVVQRKCWENLACQTSACAKAAAVLPERPVGTPGKHQLLGGVQEAD